MNTLSDLTIAITTYNREKRLLKQLHSIFNQVKSMEIQIVILDNHSDYDIKASIRDEFGDERCKKLHVVINPANFGMGANLALPFLHCHTKWLWTLSDDDETRIDALDIIENDIDQDPDTILFKYNYVIDDEGVSKIPFRDVDSLPSLIDFYYENDCPSGHFIFLSNNVYNMEYVVQFYGLTLTNSYCSIAQLLPMMYALDNHAGIVRFREKSIVIFKRPEPGASYKYLSKAVEISTTAMLDFNMPDEYHKKLGFLVTNGFSHYKLVRCALLEKDTKRGKFLYKQVYSRSFKYSGSVLDKLYLMLFYICQFTHIPLPYNSALKCRSRIRKYFPLFR